MGSIGAPEILVILVLALLVLGPERLPAAARTAGRWMHEIRKVTSSLQAEVQTVVEEVMQPVQSTMTSASDAYTSTVGTVTAATPEADPESATGTTPSEATAGIEEQSVPFDPSLN
jgi:Tat protein translocase TatB subunit